MNAFEDIVRGYLEKEGYWVKQSVKVYISKVDKAAIGTPSMPTPEIDLVAFKTNLNELLLIEAKSYLDSYGVRYEAIAVPEGKGAERYKLFTRDTYREKVTNQLKKQFLDQGLIDSKTRVNYALAAGHVYSGDEPRIMTYFSGRGWKVFTPNQIKQYVAELANKGWEDNLVTMTAKLMKKK